MELAAFHPAGAKNFEVAAGFLENLWSSVLEMDSWTLSKSPMKVHCKTQWPEGFSTGFAELLWCLCVWEKLDKMEKVTRKGKKKQEKKKN
jgi:hypothetical protein